MHWEKLCQRVDRDTGGKGNTIRHNGCDGVSDHQPYDCLLNCLFRRRSKKTSKLRVTGLCVGNSSVTGEFTAQMASNAENASIWWRHHGIETLHHTSQQQTVTKPWTLMQISRKCCKCKLDTGWSIATITIRYYQAASMTETCPSLV